MKQKNYFMVKSILILFSFFLLCTTTFAQDVRLSGRVTDDTGQPLPGVTIIVKGTAIGAVTDFDGNFQLDSPENAKILVFSFIGMKSKEININGKKTVFSKNGK